MIRVQVYRNNQEVGFLSKLDDGRYSFQYSKEYLSTTSKKNISVNFPLQAQAFYAENLFPFFFNMLAEGNIKKMQCLNLKIDENDAFTRLIKTATRDTIGSVYIKEVNDEVL